MPSRSWPPDRGARTVSSSKGHSRSAVGLVQVFTSCSRPERIASKRAILPSNSLIILVANHLAESGPATAEFEQELDLVQVAPHVLSPLDEPHDADRLRAAAAVARLRATRVGQQAAALVVPQRLRVHAGLFGYVCGVHVTEGKPGTRYRLKT